MKAIVFDRTKHQRYPDQHAKLIRIAIDSASKPQTISLYDRKTMGC